MMQRRDEVNITLGVIERLEFDASDDDDELMAMDIPPSKKSKNNWGNLQNIVSCFRSFLLKWNFKCEVYKLQAQH